MRNLKKFLALVLATLMLLSVAVISTSAADDKDYTEAAKVLAALDIMKGDGTNLLLENKVERYQAALFFVQALTGETDATVWNQEKKSAYFNDVTEYGTAIDYAYDLGIVRGRGDGSYGAHDQIMYQDMLVMAVRALGYETEGMAYPMGYVNAAKKLNLHKNLEILGNKTLLNRGQTAQIIHDMLFEAVVAYVDPINGKILYPDEPSTADILNPSGAPATGSTTPTVEVTRDPETLIVKSGLAGGVIEGTINSFAKADEDVEGDFDKVNVTVTNKDANKTQATLDIRASHFGITEDTPSVEYKGLKAEFFIKGDILNQPNYEDGKTTIIFANQYDYETVVNLGDYAVKYVQVLDASGAPTANSYLSLGGVKFTDAKYYAEVYTFNGTTGWTRQPSTAARALATVFQYDTTTGTYTNDTDATTGYNTYYAVDYRVYDKADTTGTTSGKTRVDMFITPLSFGQFAEREINGVKYTAIGTHDGSAVATHVNLDGELTFFVERLVKKTGTGLALAETTTKVTTSQGADAASVKVEGVEVKTGDFMFYNYNNIDNVLTVYANCGGFQTGRLTSKTTSATTSTIKLSGTNYEVGFDGLNAAWEADFTVLNTIPSGATTTPIEDYLNALEADKDNAKFVVVNGKVVHIEPVIDGGASNTYDYAIVTLNENIMMGLLDLDPTDTALGGDVDNYRNSLTYGVYVEDGVAKVAMLNLTTGKWELVPVSTYFAGTYNTTKAEWPEKYDVVVEVGYSDLMDNGNGVYDGISSGDYKNAGKMDAFKTLVNGGIVAVAAVDNGVYSIAANSGFFKSGTADAYGISFTDDSTKTNSITADDTVVDVNGNVIKNRVVVDDETVIVIVDAAGNASARVGVQKEKDSVTLTATGSAPITAKFLSANSDLIVLVTDASANFAFNPANTGVNTVALWGNAAAANSDVNYYITTVDTTFEFEKNADGDFVITATNLFDMKAGALVASMVYEDANANDYVAGTVLKKNADASVTAYTFATPATNALTTAIMKAAADDNDDKLIYTGVVAGDITFDTADTATIAGTSAPVLDAATPVDVNVKVVTLNISSAAADKYDFSRAVLSTYPTTPALTVPEAIIVKNNVQETRYEYAIDLSLVNEITEPTDGVYNNFIDDNTDTIEVPEIGKEDYSTSKTVKVDVKTVYALEDGVLNIVVYKIITD